MLNEERKYYVTASQAHRVMAGFETELRGKDAVKPEFESFEQIESWITDNDKKPLVGDLKASGIKATGKDIDSAWKYIQSQKKVFSDGMFTVACEIAMSEFIEERDPGIKTMDMERGNIQEGEAIEALKFVTGINFTNTGGEQTFLSSEHLGVTPDGIEYNGFDIVSCAEVKNPKDTTHMKYLVLIHDQNDILKHIPEYYWQAQTGLYVTGAKFYHWMTYHNKFIDGYKYRHVVIEPVQKHIEILAERSERVVNKAAEISRELKAGMSDVKFGEK